MRVKVSSPQTKLLREFISKHERMINKANSLEELKGAMKFMLNEFAPMLIKSTKGRK